MITGIRKQLKAPRRVRPAHLLATLLSCAVSVQLLAQEEAESGNPDLSRLIFEVAALPAEGPPSAPGAAAGLGTVDGEAATEAGTAEEEAAPVLTPEEAALAADISSYRSRIADTLANENPYSAALREQYEALGTLLQRAGSHEEAIAAFESAMHIDRVNTGLYTLDQIPIVEKIITSHRALGNFDDVNDLHEYLYYIRQKNYSEGDPRLLDAKEDWADWNLQSYLSEGPPNGFVTSFNSGNASLDRGGYVAVQTRDGSFVYVPRSQLMGMMNPLGTRAVFDPMFMSTYGIEAERVVDERLRTARDYYEEIIEAKAATDSAAGAPAAEKYRVEHKLASVAYAMKTQLDGMDTVTDSGSLYSNRGFANSGGRYTAPPVVTRGYSQNRESLEAIAQELEQDAAATVMEKAQAYIALGDWNIAYDYPSRAEDAYIKAWDLLKAAGMDAAGIAEVFMPEPLIPAPAFAVHKYSREMYGLGAEDELAYKGHMDLTVNVSRYGDVNGVEIDAVTPGTQQVLRSELIDFLREQKMRPAVADGETVRRENVKLRYYYSY